MTETPRPQSQDSDEPVSGSNQFVPGKTTPGAKPASPGPGGGSTPSGSSGSAPTARTAGAGGTTKPSASGQSGTTGTGTAPSTTTGDNPLARTRASGLWVGIIVFAVILILLLVFVVQNTAKVEIEYFVFKGHISLAVAMLLSAAAGVLLAAIAGSLRILQLRRRLKRANTG